MGTSDFLSIGVSGLQGSQAAITTTSHNIANINTEGYSRQVVGFGTKLPNFVGTGYIGSGVVTNNVQRMMDSLALLDLRANITNHSGLETFVSQSSRIDSVVADPTTGLSPAIQNFFDAMQAVSNDPGSSAARQSLFSQSDLLINRFKILDDQLSTQRISINNELSAVGGQVTSIGSAIADINIDIVGAIGASSSGAMPNDLLDKRDQLINDLSKLVKVAVVEQKDGSANIFIGNGQALVIGGDSNVLSAETDPADPLNSQMVISRSGVSIPVTKSLVGGTLGGLISYRNEMLAPAINRLGLVAMGLASSINDQHQKGMDLNGEIGGLFFNDINNTLSEQSRVTASSLNTGNATITMTIDDVNQVSVTDYSLSFNAGSYTLRSTTDNTILATFVDPGVGTFAVAAEGFTLNFTSGTSSNGDSYFLTPTRSTVGILNKSVSDVTQIAAASPITASSNLGNTGSAEITGSSVSDATTASFATAGVLSPPLRFVFTSATTYNVVNDTTGLPLVPAASGVYDPARQNDMMAQAGLTTYGYEVKIGGAANSGDTFNVEYNTGGVGDNSNALAMASVQTENILNQSTSTLQEAYGLLVSEVGTRTNEGKISLNASESLLRQTESRVQQVSGVNLDEEAAKLIKFQQSYQASAQIISTAQTIFDTLLSAVR